jgi:hypothetical protein
MTTQKLIEILQMYLETLPQNTSVMVNTQCSDDKPELAEIVAIRVKDNNIIIYSDRVV